MRIRTLILGLVLALSASAAGAQSDFVAPAIKDPARPAADRLADAQRKPAETLALAGVGPGQKVIELFPGGGYFSRLLSKSVGPAGKVYLLTWQEPQTGRSRNLARDPAYANTVFFGDSPLGFKPAEPIDLIFTVQNYHDIETPQRAQINQLAFRWLKSGGVYFIADHAAVDGSGYAGLVLHRIDRALVIKEVTAAGFKLVGESQALRNPGDTRLTNVFNPGIRGKTDQFMLKFVKP